ncbi:hypothetical protein XFF6990_390125 [Xanthomonas citri pv. fuscans]|nr:hypothetical protein XFF6990_390125 [Xanthomonas citri pv. fuscans]
MELSTTPGQLVVTPHPVTLEAQRHIPMDFLTRSHCGARDRRIVASLGRNMSGGMAVVRVIPHAHTGGGGGAGACSRMRSDSCWMV